MLASPLAVADCAIVSVAACLTAAADLAAARTGRRPGIALDTDHVAAAMRSEVWLRDPDRRGIDGFAPLSRLWRAADGWVRTHANYPGHRKALLAALGVPDGRDSEVQALLGEIIAARPAVEVERVVYAAGGLAVAARTQDQWQDETRSGTAGTAPLVGMTPLGRGSLPPAATADLPASGLKVLDLTRVIAGPVGTRMLGALGAEVLRVDDPHRPELPLHAVDGTIGKASASLDAGTEDGRQTLHRLLDQADVLVTGYRPGVLPVSCSTTPPARTARWLLDQGIGQAGPSGNEDPQRRADSYRTALGNGWSGISPPGSLDGRPLRWGHLPPAYAQAPAGWN